MNSFLVPSILLTAALGIASVRAEEADKETEKALEATAENAKRMGIKMPDLKALMEEEEKEETAPELAKATATPKVAKTSGAISLPDWTPSTPQFTPAGPIAKKTIQGEEKIVLSGTSPLSPVALAEAWEKLRKDGLGSSRAELNINDTITRAITYRELNGEGEVELRAVRGPRDKVTQVTISAPLPK